MALMVPPTHPCPTFDNGLVRKGKATLGQRGRDDRVDRSGRRERNSPAGQGNRGVRRGRHSQKCRSGGTARAGPNRRYRVRFSFALRCTAMATDHLSKGGDVWVGGTVVPHGYGSRAPMDGFTARPANPHTPRPGQGQPALTLFRGRENPTKNPLHKQRVLRCCHYVAEASSIRTCSSRPACRCGPTPRTPTGDPWCRHRSDTARWSGCFPAAAASAHAGCCCRRRCS